MVQGFYLGFRPLGLWFRVYGLAGATASGTQGLGLEGIWGRWQLLKEYMCICIYDIYICMIVYIYHVHTHRIL